MIRRVFLIVLVGFCCLGSLHAQEQHLLLLHTNDIHASFIPHEATWVKTTPRPMVGGFAMLQDAVDSIRGTGLPTLLLDAGDVNTGNPISEISYEGAYGGALIEMMNRLGYAAWCPGNHDFDISSQNMKDLAAAAHFPTLCANLVNDKGDLAVGTAPYAIVERGGLKIGIIGLMTQELYSLVLQRNLAGIKVLSLEDVAQKIVDGIRPQVNLVVLLTHEGADEDAQLAEKLHGVDVIVGGHSHTRLRVPKTVNNIKIVQTGANLENLGVLDITFRDGKPVRFWGDLIQLWAHVPHTKGGVLPLVDSMQQRIDADFNEVIGTLAEDWSRQDAGNPLGLYITEVQRQEALADVAFMNVHGIRKDLLAGKITKRHLFEVLPFRNVLATFQLSGAQVKSILRFYIEKHPAVIMAGITGTWHQEADGTTLFDDVQVNGKPLVDNQKYVCAASDYLVGESEKYLGVPLEQVTYSDVTLYSAVEHSIRKAGKLVKQGTFNLQRSK